MSHVAMHFQSSGIIPIPRLPFCQISFLLRLPSVSYPMQKNRILNHSLTHSISLFDALVTKAFSWEKLQCPATQSSSQLEMITHHWKCTNRNTKMNVAGSYEDIKTHSRYRSCHWFLTRTAVDATAREDSRHKQHLEHTDIVQHQCTGMLYHLHVSVYR